MGAKICSVEKTTVGKLVMRVSALEGHRIWAPIYESGLNPIKALARRTMRNLLEPLSPPTVIDVACGTGKELLAFQSAGSEVFGCDACLEMVEEASKEPSLRGRVALADAEWLPFGCGTADLVICSLSFGYFKDIDRVFAEFRRTAKADGVIAVSDVHPEVLASGWTRSFRLGSEVYEIEHYQRTPEELDRAALGAGLSRKLCREVRFGATEFELFREAGKVELYDKVRQVPALFIALWKRAEC